MVKRPHVIKLFFSSLLIIKGNPVINLRISWLGLYDTEKCSNSTPNITVRCKLPSRNISNNPVTTSCRNTLLSF